MGEKYGKDWLEKEKIAAGSSSNILNFNLSDNAARDFKDAMEAIDDAGKYGTMAEARSLWEMIGAVMASPFIKNLTDLFAMMQKIMDSGAAEAAAKWRAALFNEEDIQTMYKMRDAWHDITLGVTDAILNFKKLTAVGGPLDIDLKPIIEKYDRMGYELGDAFMGAVIKGIEDGLDNARHALEDYFEDLIEDL